MTPEPAHGDPGAVVPANDADEAWSAERIAQSIARIKAMAREMDVQMPLPPPQDADSLDRPDAW